MLKIAWITPSHFIDVDLPIVVELQKEMQIYWLVVSLGKITDDTRNYIEPCLKGAKNIKVEYDEILYRFYDFRTMLAYCSVVKKTKAFKPDLYYTSLQAAPFGPLIYRMFLPIKETVAACHNVSTPKGANQETYARIFTDLHLRTFENIQVFSESQRDVLLKKYPKKNVLLAPLAIKDYGDPRMQNRTFDENNVVFLFFGKILGYKRVDLLIEAAQNLYEFGYHNFKIKIAGGCKNWTEYQMQIKYPELFVNKIEHIPNDAVADLFFTSDYFVMPYQDIAQSGAITVAYRYNLPIILSDLPQFRPFGDNGVTGFFFENMNVKDLEEKMIRVIEGGKPLHDYLCQGLEKFVNERYSTPAIAKEYKDYFKRLINKNNESSNISR